MNLRSTIVVISLLFVASEASQIDHQCSSDDDIIAHPHPESCKKYYRCTLGQLEELTCPYTLYFDVESRGCTFAESVRCVEGTEVDKWNRPICANDGRVKMVPHQMVCAKYYLCLGVNAVEKRCQEGLLFDADSGKCTFSEKARCHLDPWCPEYDQPHDLKFFPDADDCSRYSICYNQVLHQQQCSDGLLFNVELQDCTQPSESKCKINGINCWSGLQIAHPSRCNAYYLCAGAIPLYRECAQGYYFGTKGTCVENKGECSLP